MLALAVFARRLAGDQPKLTYSTGLELRLGQNTSIEVDFSFWYQRSRVFGLEEEPALVFGEGKSFAVDSFKTGDIHRMRTLAERFPGAFMVFATLKDELTTTEKTEIGQFSIWGRELLPDGHPRTPVIVLTAVELFCSWHVEQTWKDAGGLRASMVQSPSVRMDNLWTLANLTQQVYLDLPDPHARPNPLPPEAQPPSDT